jgi:predicted class III extradiol MEMO1 family dioxygenase
MEEPKKKIREATHAGTWYSKERIELDKQIDSWLETSKKEFKEVT